MNPLNSKWVFWEQSNNVSNKNYGQGDKEVCEFDTVEDFWRHWSFIPRPRYAALCFNYVYSNIIFYI
jgi:hypothetical protein